MCDFTRFMWFWMMLKDCPGQVRIPLRKTSVYARGSKRSHQSALGCVTVVDSTTLKPATGRPYTPVTRRSVNAVTPPRPKQADCSVTFIILCVAVTRHDCCVTPSRLIEGTAARPSYDSPTNCVTGPRLAHDRHGIIILIHDRRTTPSRRFQDLCVTLLGYIKS